MWNDFESGASLGTRGSEGGRIIHDQEKTGWARITLEESCRKIPFAITCGLYGWMVHTRYVSDLPKANAEFEAMRHELEQIVTQIQNTPSSDLAKKVAQLCEEFVSRYP